MFDFTISLGNLLTIAGILGTLALYIIDTRFRTDKTGDKVKSVEDKMQEIVEQVAVIAQDNRMIIETLRREFGDTGAALREKIRDVELYIRDNYVKIDALRDMTNALNAQNNEVKSWMVRIEAKLERRDIVLDKLIPSYVEK